ncbi:unnamed protein product [Eruca vesicaria subsp. sativa]|uniref:PI4-kinase N-terminal domain-containing protein n=1 Tax=Eruca vesicaria subsp. sativa TaxID=29727 RepID=A0ABC8KNJ4_ERUVS|nr:unnamed protein product [Eruca vesicaria subsp. sativa]
MKACKELFISLLSGIAAVAKGRCSPHGLFVRLKPLVLAVCAQPDTWVGNQRNIFESLSKICCEIIESIWVKDRALVNTFIGEGGLLQGFMKIRITKSRLVGRRKILLYR